MKEASYRQKLALQIPPSYHLLIRSWDYCFGIFVSHFIVLANFFLSILRPRKEAKESRFINSDLYVIQ